MSGPGRVHVERTAGWVMCGTRVHVVVPIECTREGSWLGEVWNPGTCGGRSDGQACHLLACWPSCASSRQAGSVGMNVSGGHRWGRLCFGPEGTAEGGCPAVACARLHRSTRGGCGRRREARGPLAAPPPARHTAAAPCAATHAPPRAAALAVALERQRVVLLPGGAA